jgi:hypothetical protein
MMTCVLVVVLLAKLRIGTGQGVVELLQFVGFTVGYLAHRLCSNLLPCPDTRPSIQRIWDHGSQQGHGLHSPSHSSSHRDLGSLLNRLYSAIAA